MKSYIDILPHDMKEELCLYITIDTSWKTLYSLLIYKSFSYLITDKNFWKKLYSRDLSAEIPPAAVIMYYIIRSKLDRCSSVNEKLVVAAQYNCRCVFEKILPWLMKGSSMSHSTFVAKTWHLENYFGVAIQHGHLDLLKFFLSTSDVLYLDSFEALILSIRSCHLHLVKYIASTGFIIKGLFLLECAATGALEILKYLLNLGLSIYSHSNRVLTLAATHGHMSIVEYCIEQGMLATLNNSEAFREACIHNKYGIVKFLLEHGANIHANNDEALRMSIIRGHSRVVEYLINKGANVHNEEALLYAINFRRKDVMKMLVERGASIRNLSLVDLCKFTIRWIL